MFNRTCCFTGHRDLPRDKDKLFEIQLRTKEAIKYLINNKGVKYYGVGGALGYDLLAANELIKLRNTGFTEYKDIKIILIAPFHGYTNNWSDEQRAELEKQYKDYNKIVWVTNNKSKAAYILRDRHMIDNSKYVIAYKVKNTGGTAFTVDYAVKKNRVIINIADEVNLDLLTRQG